MRRVDVALDLVGLLGDELGKHEEALAVAAVVERLAVLGPTGTTVLLDEVLFTLK